MVEDKLRDHFDYSLAKLRWWIYSILALLLSVTSLQQSRVLGNYSGIALSHWTIATQTLRVLKRIVGCVDARGDLAHGSHLDSFACSRH